MFVFFVIVIYCILYSSFCSFLFSKADSQMYVAYFSETYDGI